MADSNEVSKGMHISRAKLKAARQEERIHVLKEHFNNLFGKSPNFTDKSIWKIINNQLDIKLEKFTQEKLDVVLRKIKKQESCRKLYGRQGNSITYISDTPTQYITRTQ